MILGAVVFRLRALKASSLPASHGRLLHAALLNLIRDAAPKISAAMHDSAAKNFAVNALDSGKTLKSNTIDIREGDVFSWRVCAIGEEVLQAILSIPMGSVVKIAAADFVLEECVYQQEKYASAGIVSMEDLLAGCRELPVMRSVTLDFLSPTAFKVGKFDYPFPLPQLIFGSLADRWNEFSDVGIIDAEQVKQLAEKLVPFKWHAETKRYNITPQRGITGFVGSITFDMQAVEEDIRWLFVLLTEFAAFTGVGRLTAQGLGHVKISYRQ